MARWHESIERCEEHVPPHPLRKFSYAASEQAQAEEEAAAQPQA